MFLDTAPPLPRLAHRLGLSVESHDPGTQPLPDGAAWWANRRSNWLPHGLFRSDGVPKLEGSTSLEGSVGGSLNAVREEVGEVDGVVAVRGASDPWGQPRGPMEMRAIRRITDASTGPVTTEMQRLSFSSSPPSSSP
jgi:hypothetical protein